MKTSVQFAVVPRSKAVRCENAYPEERTKKIFINSTPAKNQSVVMMFWGCEQNARLLECSRCTDTLLKQYKQVPSPVMVLIQRKLFSERSSSNSHCDCGGRRKAQLSQKLSVCQADTKKEIPLKLENHGIYSRIRQVAHRRVCLGKDRRVEIYPCLLRFVELAQKMEANHKQIISSRSWKKNRRSYYSSYRYTDRNSSQKYDAHLRIPNKIQ